MSVGSKIGPNFQGEQHLSYDFHGSSVKVVKKSLGEIFSTAEEKKLHRVTLITGLGIHSPNNFSVLFRKTVPDFLKKPEIEKNLSEVKRDPTGAYEVTFKREDPDVEKAKEFKSRVGPLLFRPEDFASVKKKAEEGSIEDQFTLSSYYMEGYAGEKNPAEGVCWMKMAANNGHAFAMRQLGLMYEVGLEVPKCLKKAREWYEKGAAKNEPYSLFKMGSFYWLGSGVVKDDKLAVSFLGRSADLDEPYAAYNLAYILLKGTKVIPADPVRAKKLLEQAVKANLVCAQVLSAKQHFFGLGIPKDYKAASKLFHLAALANDPIAEYYLGRIKNEGLGCKEDEKEAFEWFQKAAEHGDRDAKKNVACAKIEGPLPIDVDRGLSELKELAARGHFQSAGVLGLYYFEGGKVKKDIPLAIKYLTEGAKGGDLTSKKILSSIYLEGEDPAQGERLLREAAREDDPEALYLLALFLERSGKGTKEEIFDCYSRAAEQEFPEAEHLLGLSYLDGDIVDKDEAKAFFWLERAAKKGIANAQYEVGKHLVTSKEEGVITRGVCFLTTAAKNNFDAAMLLAFCCKSGKGISPSYEKYLFWRNKAFELATSEQLKSTLQFYFKQGALQEGVFLLKVAAGDRKSVASTEPPTPSETFKLLSDFIKDGYEESPDPLRYLLAIAHHEGFQLDNIVIELAKKSSDFQIQFTLSLLLHTLGRNEEAKIELSQTVKNTSLEEGDVKMQIMVWNLLIALSSLKEKDSHIKQAITFFKKKQENSATLYYIGSLYTLLQEHSEAFKWFLKAANHGDVEANLMIGYAYQEGIGIFKNTALAIKWYLIGAKNDHPGCMTKLACLLLETENVDMQEVIRWLQAAVEHKFADAEFILGHLYFTQGNREVGLNLLSMAASHGSKDAQEFLDNVK